MPEYPAPEDRPRRGRRDPDLAQRIEQDIDLGPAYEGNVEQHDDGDQEPLPLINVGDEVAAKVTLAMDVGDPDKHSGDASYFTYEMRTKVMPGESEEEVNERVTLVVNTRVMNLVDDMEARLEARRQEARSRPIQRRS